MTSFPVPDGVYVGTLVVATLTPLIKSRIEPAEYAIATCCHVLWTMVPPIVNEIALWNPTNAVPFVPSASESVDTKFVPLTQ